MKEKELTAVEWLMTKLQSLGVTKEEHYELLCQLELEAKIMEKEQMIEFASNCIHRNSCFFNIEEYYEKFKQQEQ